MGYLLAALLGGFLVFNSQATPRKAEKIAESALQKRFPGATVDVSIEGKRGMNVLHGKFSKVRILLAHFGTLSEVPLQVAGTGGVPNSTKRGVNRGSVGLLELQLRDFLWNDLHIDAADLTFQNVVFDRDLLKDQGRISLLSSGAATAHLTIPAASLETLMRSRLKDVQEARLTLQNGQVRVTGKRPAPLVGVLVPFTLTANLKTRNANQIWLDEPQVKVGDVPLLPAMTNSLLGDINPIYVFDRARKWPFLVELTAVQTIDNKLELNGNLTFAPPVTTPPATNGAATTP
jgi:hypothetical protein